MTKATWPIHWAWATVWVFTCAWFVTAWTTDVDEAREGLGQAVTGSWSSLEVGLWLLGVVMGVSLLIALAIRARRGAGHGDRT